MRKLLYNCYIVIAEIGISIFLLELLYILTLAVLCLNRYLVEMIGEVVAILFSDLLFLLSLLIYLFLQLYRYLVKIIRFKNL